MNDPMPSSLVNDRARRWVERERLPATTTLDLLAGDASDRRFVRVSPPTGPTRVLVVHPEPIDATRLPLIQVSALFRQLPVLVPAIHGVEPDLGIVVLDDLGDTTLEVTLEGASGAQRDAYYDEAVEIIATIQRGGRRLAATANRAFTVAFDVETLSFELGFFVANFLERYRRCALSSATRARLDDDLRVLALEISREPRVLCHRDFHSRNLMVHRGRLHVIDLQDARMGPDTYDLVSLLRDSYVGLDRDTVERHVRQFIAQADIADGDACRRRFARTAVQRHLKALGTFGHQIAVRGRSRYEDAVPRTLAYLRQTFRDEPRYARLHDVLATLLPELRA